jgi:WD repeat-containing protein 23
MVHRSWGQKFKHPNDASIMTYRGHEVVRTLIRARFSPLVSTGSQFVYAGSGVSTGTRSAGLESG